MKFFLKVWSIIIVMLFCSCSSDGSESSKVLSEDLQPNYQSRLTCPEGYHIAWEVSYSGINFRTRKSDCKTGFGLFCAKDRKAGWVCVGDNGEASVPMIEQFEQDNSLQQRTTIVGEEMEDKDHMKL